MKLKIKIGIISLAIILISIVFFCCNTFTNNYDNVEPASNISSETLADTIESNNINDIAREKEKNHLIKEKNLNEDKSIATTVNGELIYQSEIEIKIDTNKIKWDDMNTYINTLQVSEEERTQILKEYEFLLSDRKTVLNELIRNKVICLQAKKQNVAPSEKEVLLYAKEKLDVMKDSLFSTYNIFQLYMEVMSEEELLEQLIRQTREEIEYFKLYDEITKDIKGENKKEKTFKKAVDKWVAEADIVTLIEQK